MKPFIPISIRSGIIDYFDDEGLKWSIETKTKPSGIRARTLTRNLKGTGRYLTYRVYNPKSTLTVAGGPAQLKVAHDELKATIQMLGGVQ